MLKQRNDELFEENRRLQQEHHRLQQNQAWRSTLQQAYGNEPPPPQSSMSSQQLQQASHIENIPPSSPLKSSTMDSKRERPKGKLMNSITVSYFLLLLFYFRCIVIRSDSPNMSEGSDSTNYLTTVSVERYNNRPLTSIHRSATLDGNNHHRTARYSSLNTQDEYNRNTYSNSLSKSIDIQGNYRSSKSKRSVEWDEENIQQKEGKIFSIENIEIKL